MDYKGKRFIIELKIWHGQEYHTRGEKQIFDYLEYYQEKKDRAESQNTYVSSIQSLELEFLPERSLGK